MLDTQKEVEEQVGELRKACAMRLRPSYLAVARKSAKKQGVPIGKVIEDCIKAALMNDE